MNEPLSVLLVTLDYPPPPGGIQTVVKNLECGLVNLGHEAEVLHINTADFDWRPADFLPRPRWIYTARSIIDRDFVYLNAVYRQTVMAIERFDPDVVHAMHIKNWSALIAANEHDIPSVVSTHALELGNESLAIRAIHEADTVHAVSGFTASLIESVVDIDPTVEIIPPSIDVSAYQNAIETGSSEKTEPAPVLVIGRFVDRKNIETVVEAWSRLDMSVRDGRELVIVGNGPNRTALETLVYSDDARFTGWINNSEKRCLLSKADAFVMVPRRDGYDVEGFGIVYIEAQASATPIVGSKHGGVPEAIGGAGIIVDDEEDPDEVAAATEAVLTCEAIRQRCLSAAAERIDRFDIVSVAQQHVAAYKNI